MSRPRLPARPWLLRGPGILLAATLAISWHLAGGDLGALLSRETRAALGDFARGFLPPAHSLEFLALLVRPLAETVAIALLGLGLAVALALPLGLLATAPEALRPRAGGVSGTRRAAFLGARAILVGMRSVPEIVWALVLVRAVGMGPAAGVLAIGIGYAGVLGKVLAEILESAPRGPARALAGAGATPLGAFAFGLLPSSLPTIVSYVLYRFDCALRASAVLGLVGAGGIGAQLQLSIKALAYDEVATLVLALFALVASVDLLSHAVRRRVRESRGVLPVGGAAAVRIRAVALGALVAASLGACAFLDLPLRELLSPAALRAAASFASSAWPPDLDAGFLRAIVPAALETLAVSVVGTAMAAALGLLLAWPAAHRLHALDPRASGRLARIGVAAAALLARGLMNLGRTLPELLWALVLVLAVGLGPFAGALALGVHTAGVLGRLYAEALEEVPTAPFAALRGVGASGAAASLFAVLPQALPQLVAYTLYRWEVNIRAAAVLGVVGAGGIGTLLHVSLGLFHQHRALTLVLVVLLLVGAVDLLSGALRRLLVEGPAEEERPPRSAAAPAVADTW